MKFVVDCMLGKLAKWLKILGFDTLFFSKIGDDELIAIAKKEERVLLTRDNELFERSDPASAFFIKSEGWQEQLKQVLDGLKLRDKAKPYSRCIECNSVLKDLSRDKAKNLVTLFVYKNAAGFALCPVCGRVFWQGSHQKDMAVKIDEFLK